MHRFFSRPRWPAGRAARTLAIASCLALAAAGPALPRQRALGAGLPDATPVRLTGSVPAIIANGRAVPLGATSPGTALHLGFMLRGQDPAGLRQFVDAVSDPTSPLYRQYLSEPQYVARFGPTGAALGTLLSYLRAQGLRVTHIYSGGQLVDADTTVARAEQVFAVQFQDYRAPDGQVFYAATQDPQLPANVASLLTAVVGLNDIRPVPRFVRPTDGRVARDVPLGGYGPDELRAAYDLEPLFNSTPPITGAGQTVALMELDGYNHAAITAYDQHFGLTPPAAQDISADGTSVDSTDGDGEIEVELDIEVVNAIAPGAKVLVYIGASDMTVYQKIASDDLAQAVSSSWGICESQSSAQQEAAYDTINMQMAAQGQSFLFASGDTGTYCNPDLNGLDVSNDIGPHVTVVGGTSLTINGTGPGASYNSETTWNDGSGAGSGGLSQFWTESDAPWQQGPGVNNAYDAAVSLPSSSGPTASGSSGHPRQMPDVSADGDKATGYYTEVGEYQNKIYGVYQQQIGGTSAAAPLWAGLIALSNQYAQAHGAANAGFLNPTLYDLARGYPAAPAYAPFHDVTVGNNDPTVGNGGNTPSKIPGCTIPASQPVCYPATAGYDLATGLGTPDGYNLIRDLAAGAGTGGAQSAAIQSQPGWSLISLPLTPSAPVRAYDVLRGIQSSGKGTLTAIYALAGGAWSSPALDSNGQLSGQNFTLQPGVGYLVYSDAGGSYTESSTAATSAASWSLAAGWNLVGVTQGAGSPTAYTVLPEIQNSGHGTLTAIYALSGGAWSSPALDSNGQLSGQNIALAAGQGYLVYTDAGANVTPGAATQLATAAPGGAPATGVMPPFPAVPAASGR